MFCANARSPHELGINGVVQDTQPQAPKDKLDNLRRLSHVGDDESRVTMILEILKR